MRMLSLTAVSALSLIASGALAEEFVLESTVTTATVYPRGALVTRVVPFELEDGAHTITIADLPAAFSFESLRVKVEGARLGATSFRNNFVPSQPDRDTTEITAARDKIKSIEDQIQSTLDASARVRLVMDASQARIAFLKQLGASDDMASASADTLRALVQMVGEETLSAREAAFQAQLEAREIDTQLTGLREDLAKAQQDLNALVPEVQDRSALTLAVIAQGASTGTVTLEYYDDNAMWRPAYDLHLTRSDDPTLRIDRIAYVAQNTGENWDDVQLVLSTVTPSDRTEPSPVPQRPVRIGKPQPVPMKRVQVEAMSDLASPRAAAPAMVEMAESAAANFDGPAVTYVYDTPISMASGADAGRIMLGELTETVDIYAHAVPVYDATAFMMAEFTNTSGERILPADQGFLYIDEALIGVSYITEIAAGETTALSFGPIQGVQINRTVTGRNEGDRGIISRSNEQTEGTLIEVKNLTSEDWDIRLFDAVPYSEQEDLEVEWQANPRPTNVDDDNKRGVLRWDFTLEAGNSQTIETSTQLKWPDGQVLQQPRVFR